MAASIQIAEEPNTKKLELTNFVQDNSIFFYFTCSKERKQNIFNECDFQ